MNPEEFKKARAIYMREWRKKNSAAARAIDKRKRLKNTDKFKAAQKTCYLRRREYYFNKAREIYRAIPIEKSRELRRAWSLANPLKVASSAKKYRQKYRHKITAWTRERQLRIITPSWADKMAIAKIYSRARDLTDTTGIRHHVDHIIPIASEFVCGLHCEANLQILTAAENIRKKNKFI